TSLAQWRFVETGDVIDPETFLDGHEPVRATVELSYDGGAAMPGGGERAWNDVERVVVSSFTFHCSPFLVDVHTRGGGVVHLAVHTADAWTPFAQGDAETDARAYKSLKGTVVVRGSSRPAGDDVEAQKA